MFSIQQVLYSPPRIITNKMNFGTPKIGLKKTIANRTFLWCCDFVASFFAPSSEKTSSHMFIIDAECVNQMERNIYR